MAFLGPGPSWLLAEGMLTGREQTLCQIPLGHSPMIVSFQWRSFSGCHDRRESCLVFQGHSGVYVNWKIWGMLALDLILKCDFILTQGGLQTIFKSPLSGGDIVPHAEHSQI